MSIDIEAVQQAHARAQEQVGVITTFHDFTLPSRRLVERLASQQSLNQIAGLFGREPLTHLRGTIPSALFGHFGNMTAAWSHKDGPVREQVNGNERMLVKYISHNRDCFWVDQRGVYKLARVYVPATDDGIDRFILGLEPADNMLKTTLRQVYRQGLETLQQPPRVTYGDELSNPAIIARLEDQNGSSRPFNWWTPPPRNRAELDYGLNFIKEYFGFDPSK